jgi:hypothetical protein
MVRTGTCNENFDLQNSRKTAVRAGRLGEYFTAQNDPVCAASA